MDGNKDEALRCIKLAEDALASGDKHRVLKFIRIAKRLDGTVPVDGLLQACEKLGISNPHPLGGEARAERSSGGPASSNASGTLNGDSNYTGEHARLIREIKKHKDYYAVLGVEKSCSVEEVRRAYRRLSLKVHPDKNKAPGADEAFKTVSKAFKCLSDEESRREYDQIGLIGDHEVNQHGNNMRRRRRRTTGNDFFDEPLDPDEIFRSFFFGSQGDAYRAQRVHRTRGASGRQREQNVQGGGFNFVIVAQVLLVFLFLLFAYLPFSDPQYSLQKTYTYQIPKITEKHEVDYFVKSEGFDQKFPHGSSARDDLENEVFRDYRSILRRYCHMELQRRQWARNYPTPHCDKLRRLEVS